MQYNITIDYPDAKKFKQDCPKIKKQKEVFKQYVNFLQVYAQYTQKEIAQLLGISLRSMQDYMNENHQSVPNFSVIFTAHCIALIHE